MPRHPSLYQINTRVRHARLTPEGGNRSTLAEIDEATIDGSADQGFNDHPPWCWNRFALQIR